MQHVSSFSALTQHTELELNAAIDYLTDLMCR